LSVTLGRVDARDGARRAATRGGRRRRRPTPWTLALGTVALLLAVKAFAMEPMRIASDSMAPTLVAGEQVLIDKLRYRSAAPRPGELAAFEAAGSGEVMLKRIVAVGGDSVAIEDGALVVDGSRRTEPYVDSDQVDSVYFGPVTVPSDTVFVLGDNRANSIDSRDFGAVPVDRLIGPVVTRMWPPRSWGMPR
jgi:signal peptidase I